MLPRWLDGDSPQKRGRKFEKKLAKQLGGRVQPASGALPFNKEDVKTDRYLIQTKLTTKKQYTIKQQDLDTLLINATKIGKQAAFILSIGGKSWVMTLMGV